MLTASIYWGLYKELKRYCHVYPLRLSQDLAPYLHCCFLAAPSLISPLEFRDTYGGWSLFPTNKKRGTQKGFHTQGPHRVLLSFSLSYAFGANYSTSEDWSLQGPRKPGVRFSDPLLLQLCGGGVAYPVGPPHPLWASCAC